MRPSLSIVIAAYQAEATLQEAIRSALQVPLAAEVIVVNDGSTDGTARILEEFGPQVRAYHHDNRGAARSRTRGGRLAREEWLLFLDADDLLLREGLEALWEKAQEGEAGVVYGGVAGEGRESRDHLRFHTGAVGPAPWPAQALFWKNLIAAPGCALVRKSLFGRVGGFSKDQPSDDRQFWLRCGVLGDFAALEAPVLRKRLQPGSVSHQRDRSIFHQYWYLLDFLDWCSAQGVDPGIFGTTKQEIVETGLCHALEERALQAFTALLSLSRVEGYQGRTVANFWRWRWLAQLAPGWMRKRWGTRKQPVRFGRPMAEVRETVRLAARTDSASSLRSSSSLS